MRVIALIILMLFCVNTVSADETTTVQESQVNPLTTPQNIPFESCTKMFTGINKEKLFYLALSSIPANRFKIEEIQTINGYIIFKAAGQKYLATIAEIDKNNSILRITPCNNIFFFQPAILVNTFNFIESNKNTEIK